MPDVIFLSILDPPQFKKKKAKQKLKCISVPPQAGYGKRLSSSLSLLVFRQSLHGARAAVPGSAEPTARPERCWPDLAADRKPPRELSGNGASRTRQDGTGQDGMGRNGTGRDTAVASRSVSTALS